MGRVLDSDIAKELLTVLAYLEDDFFNKLPNNFLNNLTILAADSSKEFFIDKNKSLDEQSLSDECKNWLAILYYQSVDEDMKNNLLDSWIKNDMNGI